MCILANGPSQKEEFDPDETQYESTICCNFFGLYQQDLFEKIKPDYYCLVDNAFFENIDMDESLSEKILQLKNSLEDSVKWKMSILTWDDAKFDFKNPNIEVKRIAHYFVEELKEEDRFELYKENLASCNAYNVAAIMIQFGIQSNYDQIDIFGLDLSFVTSFMVNEKNQVYSMDKHSYSSSIEKEGERWMGSSANLLGCYFRMLNNFEEMKRFADKYNTIVRNHSKYSYVDAFDKVFKTDN